MPLLGLDLLTKLNVIVTSSLDQVNVKPVPSTKHYRNWKKLILEIPEEILQKVRPDAGVDGGQEEQKQPHLYR